LDFNSNHIRSDSPPFGKGGRKSAIRIYAKFVFKFYPPLLVFSPTTKPDTASAVGHTAMRQDQQQAG